MNGDNFHQTHQYPNLQNISFVSWGKQTFQNLMVFLLRWFPHHYHKEERKGKNDPTCNYSRNLPLNHDNEIGLSFFSFYVLD